MLCYRDTTFCSDQDKCATYPCSRRFCEKEKEHALQIGLPVAWSPMAKNCRFYKPTPEKENK